MAQSGTAKRRRRSALNMASVTERDIMKEFASAAAAEERENRAGPGDVNGSAPGERSMGDDSPFEMAGSTGDATAGIPQDTIHDPRPTGYRWGCSGHVVPRV